MNDRMTLVELYNEFKLWHKDLAPQEKYPKRCLLKLHDLKDIFKIK